MGKSCGMNRSRRLSGVDEKRMIKKNKKEAGKGSTKGIMMIRGTGICFPYKLQFYNESEEIGNSQSLVPPFPWYFNLRRT